MYNMQIFKHRFVYEEAACILLKFWEGLDKFTLHLTLLPLNKGLAAWGSPAASECACTVLLNVYVREEVRNRPQFHDLITKRNHLKVVDPLGLLSLGPPAQLELGLP